MQCAEVSRLDTVEDTVYFVPQPSGSKTRVVCNCM